MKWYVERRCKKLMSVSLVATSYPNNEVDFTDGAWIEWNIEGVSGHVDFH